MTTEEREARMQAALAENARAAAHVRADRERRHAPVPWRVALAQRLEQKYPRRDAT